MSSHSKNVDIKLINVFPNCIFGYTRVSTVDQNPKRQELLILENYPNVTKIITDSVSGKNFERPGFQELLKMLRPNDTLVVESISRISRNTNDLLTLLKEFETNNIQLISIKENYDFSTPIGKLMITLLAGLSQMEREILLERQREGISLAKAEGKYKGRKKIILPSNFDDCLTMYLNRKNNYRIKNFMLDTGLKRCTLFKLIKQRKEMR